MYLKIPAIVPMNSVVSDAFGRLPPESYHTEGSTRGVYTNSYMGLGRPYLDERAVKGSSLKTI